MDTNPTPSQRERLVNLKAVGRRAKRPTPWIVATALLAVAVIATDAYLLKPNRGRQGERDGFRFDSVYIVEEHSEGNTSDFAVSPWFSNSGHDRLRDLVFVVYAIESGRGTASAVVSADVGELPSRTTRNASIAFELNNTKSYRIEILVLEDDYLVARGLGHVGWEPRWILDDRTGLQLRVAQAQLVSRDFTFDYENE